MMHHYRRLLVMIGLHFIAMYVFMYAMVNAFANVYNSLNQVYMAALMTSSMVLIELPLMWSMYKSKKVNIAMIVVGVVVLIGSWFGIRQQLAISDRQFLRSMIPHHAGAILMCEKASLQDQETRTLCKKIIAGQQAEIDQMKAKLDQLAK
ncbi:MAG TPA: DUF305 domain-containing protein [Pyrinomonadaceae bacterium]|nr:DUF305 domain-containing protein [Pyrinomonadaceae bacterium]